ncbi:hypothetical protein GCM10023212_41980 [Luteolibacter yonseiensis]
MPTAKSRSHSECQKSLPKQRTDDPPERCPEFKLQLALPNGNPDLVKERRSVNMLWLVKEPESGDGVWSRSLVKEQAEA